MFIQMGKRSIKQLIIFFLLMQKPGGYMRGNIITNREHWYHSHYMLTGLNLPTLSWTHKGLGGAADRKTGQGSQG